MSRLDKLYALKIQYQIGVIGFEELVGWNDSQLKSCNEKDADFLILVEISATTEEGQLAEVFDSIEFEPNDSVEYELARDLLALAMLSDSNVVKISHSMEHIENFGISTFSDKASYFKCLIEDIENDVYGNMDSLSKELISYLNGKVKFILPRH